uniref:Uncharacterized protein n=2 Tax=Emiliania huxleyi TaxID=2903 RepID=A0A7S3TD08_EMIHU
MPDIWNQHFLNVRRARGESVVVGGFGGRFQSEEDQNWHIKAVSYFVNNRVSSFYCALNPTAAGTGGLLEDDWATPRSDKLDVLSRLESSDVTQFLPPSPRPPPPPPPCLWERGSPCHFACTLTNTEAGCSEGGRDQLVTSVPGGPCFYCGHYNKDPAGCVTKYFQVPGVSFIALKRCEFKNGRCQAEFERQMCDGWQVPSPLPPPPPPPLQPTERSDSTQLRPSDSGSEVLRSVSAAPIVGGILIVFICGTLGVLLGTRCLGRCPQRRTAGASMLVGGRVAVDKTGDGRCRAGRPPIKRSGPCKGAMRLPDMDDDDDPFEVDTARGRGVAAAANDDAPAVVAGLGVKNVLASHNYDL